MMCVTRKEFSIRSEMEVVHNPTGAVFRAHPYCNPDDVLKSVKEYWGLAGAPIEEYADKIRDVASQLLLEDVDRVTRVRRLGNAA